VRSVLIHTIVCKCGCMLAGAATGGDSSALQAAHLHEELECRDEEGDEVAEDDEKRDGNGLQR